MLTGRLQLQVLCGISLCMSWIVTLLNYYTFNQTYFVLVGFLYEILQRIIFMLFMQAKPLVMIGCHFLLQLLLASSMRFVLF